MGNNEIKISSIFDVAKGTLQSSKNTPGKYTFITASSEWKTHTTYTHDCEALVFAMAASGSLGRTHYINGQFIASDLCFIMTAKDRLKDTISLRYFYYYLNAIKDEIVKATATGTSKLAINIKNFVNYEIYLPDINTQLLLVKTIEQVKTIAEQSEKCSEESLGYINLLRQEILHEAIKGKLVEQDPNDEPASILLEKIQEERERLIREKKIKKEKPLPPITKDEIPFELPRGWEWCRIGQISLTTIGGGTPSKDNPAYWGGDISWASVKDMNSAMFIKSTIDTITEEGLLNSSSNLIPKENIIICTRMGLGKININSIDVAINQDLRAVLLPKSVDKYYFYYYYRTLNINGAGMTVKGIQVENLIIMLMPLPPLNEQKRIVEKVDQLMAFCDKLEENIKQNKQHSEMLMESVLREAFIA